MTGLLPPFLILALAALSQPAPALAQTQVIVEQERREFAEWLRSSPLSPLRAVGVFPIGNGVSLGPDGTAIPLAGVEEGMLTERAGRIQLRLAGTERPLVRGRPLRLGHWQLLVSGPPGRMAVTVFGAEPRPAKPPSWFSYDSGATHRVELIPAGDAGPTRVLAPDGVEVEATEAGTVRVRLAGKTQQLRVLRLPGASAEESEMEIYFRDRSNGAGSYPAGRFVALIPLGGTRYLLDFNRARNPFCAYNTAYPCPAPWRGNSIAAAVEAGERYGGEGLGTPPEARP